MSDATDRLRKFLTISQSVVFPDEVLELFEPVETELTRLADENAELRAERDYLLINSNPTATELRRVRSAWKKDRDENAKLRELVRDVHEALRADKVGMFHKLVLISMEEDMRELGIEVDSDD